MESRFLVLLLIQAAVLALLGGCGRDGLVREQDAGRPPVIEPDLDRREIEPAQLDTENFELGVALGQIAMEDFGTNTVLGLRFAYHMTENFFVELAGGQADGGLTSFERLSGAAQLLTDEQREYRYYNLSFGYNLLPGEGFVGENRSLNTAVYVIGGAGKTSFAGDDRFTVNFGLGLRVMPLDWLAVHADLRKHLFDIDLLGSEKTSDNLEATIGVTFFF